MADVIVIGDSPTDLATALFTTKNRLSMMILDTGQTWMRKTCLFNYPGIGSIDGPNYVETLRIRANHFDAGRH